MGRMANIFGFAALLLLAVYAAGAGAQQPAGGPPVITVAAIILVEPMVETPIAIQVGPTASLPRNSFLRIKGLPAQTTFSDGHFVSPGTWALPITSLAELKLTVPLATTGRADLQLALLSIEGNVLAEAHTTLAVTAGTIGTIATPQAPATPTSRLPSSAALGNEAATAPSLVKPPTPAIQRPVAPSAPAMNPEERERAIKMLRRGDAEFAGGDVATARLLYQRAADAGLPEAALALGTTYDPNELARRGVKGLQGDPDAARKWYSKAQEMGAIGAADRIGRLPH